MTRRYRVGAVLTSIASALVLLGGIGGVAAADAASPGWQVLAGTGPTDIPPGGEGELLVEATNVGGESTDSSPILATFNLPVGVTPHLVGSACSVVGAQVDCDDSAILPPGGTDQLAFPITVAASAPARLLATVSVEGGGASRVEVEAPIVVSAEPAPPGIQAFWAGAFDADGAPATQAGGHPATAAAGFMLDTIRTPRGVITPAGAAKDIGVSLPPGFLGDPLAAPSRCPQLERVMRAPGEDGPCTEAAMVGLAAFQLQAFAEGNGGTGSGIGEWHIIGGAGLPSKEGIFDDVPAFGYPAQFGAQAATSEVTLLGSVRSAEDYGVSITSLSTPVAYKVFGAVTTLYGSPPATDGKTAFLTNPTDCRLQAEEAAAGVGPLTGLSVDTWQHPGSYAHAAVPVPVVTGCEQLGELFNPSFTLQPESHQAASPSPFTAELGVPQEGLTDPEALAAPQLKKAVVTLPRGVDVNPSSANGLEACSEAQMGLITTEGAPPTAIRFDKSEPSCPDASKLGTVAAKSPLLEETLEGTIYLAAQEENPFHSLLALYLVIDSPKNGILVKLPGEVSPDPATGQLTATFDDNPQLPVEDLKLNFRGGGPRSPLTTPAVCGTYTTHGELTPWSAPESGPPAQTEDSFSVTSGPGGGGCAASDGAPPFSPSFEAGTTSTQAGAYAPLVVKVGRKDGEQELTHLEFSLPPGLTGKLAGIPYCPDAAIAEAAAKSGKAEQASPSCPAVSEIGTVDTSAGVGSEPIHVGGHVYLAGPYKGAPLSAVVVTPAVAGPFDLGDVVVRAALEVNPETAQITAKSDEIPHILRGIPLQLRSVEIKVSRDGFTLNPTSCNPMTLGSTLSGLNGATADPSNRFQVGACNALGFKPQLKVQLRGATGRIGHPALKAVVTYPKQGAYANIARAQVNLPHSEFLDQSNLNKTCTKPVLLAGNCPKKSIYGKAKAWTPLLDKPLEGPVYLVGGYGFKLPALVADLNGQIRIVLKGKVDSGPNHGIRNTFEAVPDAPVSRFVLEMKGGKKYGLLENSEDLCKLTKAKRRAIARFTAQNGKVLQYKPLVANSCKKPKKQARKHGRGR